MRTIEPAIALRGDLRVPGDKSISHRALLLGALGDGVSEIRGLGRSADTMSTAAAVRALGPGSSSISTTTSFASTASACTASHRRPGRSTVATPVR